MGQKVCEYMVVGSVQTNCYFFYDKESKDCVVVDPGDDAKAIIKKIEEKEWKVQAILLTHGHFDHIMAAKELREALHAPVYAAKEEKQVLGNPNVNLSSQVGEAITLEADKWLEDGETISLLGQEVRCLLTPGHTAGGMCYYFPKELAIFAGDTLFEESVGRTDFPTGSMSTLIRSIRKKLFVLPEEARVFPGHGMMTTIKHEKMFNPFAVE